MTSALYIDGPDAAQARRRAPEEPRADDGQLIACAFRISILSTWLQPFSMTRRAADSVAKETESDLQLGYPLVERTFQKY